MKILVIEDEALTRENIALILRMEGYDTCTAADGRQGITSALRQQPDLILCDVTMPDTDGYSVLKAVREHPDMRGTPFIFLTARGDRAGLRHGMNLGADDYLTKPASATDILSAIRARLERESLRTAGSGFSPDFSTPEPLQKLGLTAREAEVLLWIAQGKSNGEIGAILGATENTVKKHVQHIFEKLGCESRNSAALLALERLSA
jgi:DNA-binding NarL/FixJ family response regulator